MPTQKQKKKSRKKRKRVPAEIEDDSCYKNPLLKVEFQMDNILHAHTLQLVDNELIVQQSRLLGECGRLQRTQRKNSTIQQLLVWSSVLSASPDRVCVVRKLLLRQMIVSSVVFGHLAQSHLAKNEDSIGRCLGGVAVVGRLQRKKTIKTSKEGDGRKKTLEAQLAK